MNNPRLLLCVPFSCVPTPVRQGRGPLLHTLEHGNSPSLRCQLWVPHCLYLSPPTQALRRKLVHSGRLWDLESTMGFSCYSFKIKCMCGEHATMCVWRSEEKFLVKVFSFRCALRQGLSWFCYCTPHSRLADHHVSGWLSHLWPCHRSAGIKDAHLHFQPVTWIWGSNSGLQQDF